MPDDSLETLQAEAARARARLVESGENIRAHLTPAALTSKMERTVKSSARELSRTVRRDAMRHSGLLAAVAVGAGALFLASRSGMRLPHLSDAFVDARVPSTLRATPSKLAMFSFRTLAATLAPISIGFFLGETSQRPTGQQGFAAGLLQSGVARRLWHEHFGDLQRKIVNAYDMPRMAATLMVGLALVGELLKRRDS
jgi:hypothetical protein